MTANIRRTCIYCGRWIAWVVCDECLRRIMAHMGDADLEDEQAWDAACDRLEADIRTERREQTRA